MVVIEGENKVIGKRSIPKKVAAYEVYKVLKAKRAMGLISIFGVFLVAVVAALPSNDSKIGGAITAGVLSIGYAFLLIRDITHMKDLNAVYHVEVEKKEE